MKTRNSIRAEINALYKSKVIAWISDSIKNNKPADAVRIYLGAPTRDEDVVANKDEFIKFCADWHKEITAGKVDFIEKTYPDIGTIEVPIHLVFEKIDDIATWAGHLVEFHSAESRLKALQHELPDLIDAGVENIHYLTSLDDIDFMRFVQVCKWLCSHKNSNSFIRQIPVRGIDTLWFESHRFLILNFLRDYLDLNPVRKDLLQLGLLPPPQTVRVVLLDNVLRSKVGGLRDLGITVKDLAKLDIKPRKVYFVDDLATALSIPDIPGVVIIVLPSKLSEICKISWVAHAQCAYLSGIEMRSFAIINNIRVYLPNTKSLTLNKDIFVSAKDLWSFDDIEIEELNSSMALTDQESMLYNMLAAGVFGRRAKLPLERIPLEQIFKLMDIVTDVEAFVSDRKADAVVTTRNNNEFSENSYVNSNSEKESVKEYESMSAANDTTVAKKESEADEKNEQPDNSAQIP